MIAAFTANIAFGQPVGVVAQTGVGYNYQYPAPSTGVTQTAGNSTGSNTGLAAPPIASVSSSLYDATGTVFMGTAAASVNEATGVFHLSGSTTTPGVPVPGQGDLPAGTLAATSAFANASIQDVLTVSDGAVGAPTTAKFTIAVSGNSTLGIGGLPPPIDDGQISMTVDSAPLAGLPITQPLTALPGTYTGTANVQSGIPFGVGFFLLTSGGNGTVFDFSHTATLTMLLPDGATYASASGDFLTSTVPLPASAWLLLSGLASLVGYAKRKRSVH